MIVLLSPSKSMNFDALAIPKSHKPLFSKETDTLVAVLSRLSKSQLKKCLAVSDKLAELNYQRFQTFNSKDSLKRAKPALFAYTGDVYQGIEAESYTAAQREFADAHVRIISGMYGLLRPLDRIQPYRLEMSTKLATTGAKDLYAFWKTKISQELNKTARSQKAEMVLNLASQEYSAAVDTTVLAVPFVTVHFKERKGKSYKVIGLFAKRARGIMVNYIIKKQVVGRRALTQFTEAGYRYDQSQSDELNIVFIRG